MNKLIKLLLSLVGLVYIAALLPVAVTRRAFPFYQNIHDYMRQLPLDRQEWSLYYYWFVIGLLGALILGLLVVWLYPKPQHNLTMTKSQEGQLLLTDRSITNFVHTIVSGRGIDSTKIKVKIRQRQVNIIVKGMTAKKSQINGAYEDLVTEINRKVNGLIGKDDIDVKTKIIVHRQTDHSRKNPRVV